MKVVTNECQTSNKINERRLIVNEIIYHAHDKVASTLIFMSSLQVLSLLLTCAKDI